MPLFSESQARAILRTGVLSFGELWVKLRCSNLLKPEFWQFHENTGPSPSLGKMQSIMEKEAGKTKYYIAVGVAGLIIGLTVGWFLSKEGVKTTDIHWKFGENELSINMEQDLADAQTLLDKIFSEDFSRQGTLEWLKLNQNLYNPTDPEIVPKISSLKYDDLVSKELRNLSLSREGPWAYQLDTVRIGIPPSELQPRKGYANVCENGKYFTQKLRVLSLDLVQSVEVAATGRYECPKKLKYPDIQLNAEDAARLLGTVNFSKYEQGMALILSPR